jgi:DNA modification methylase
MCGDSVSLEDVKKLMGGGIADIAFASPPYNTGGIGKNLTKDNGRSKYNDNADDMTDNEYTDFLQKYIDNACECSQYNFVNVQWLANNKSSLIDIMNANRHILGDIIIWDKARSQPAAAENVLNSEYELIFCFHDKGNRAIGTIPFHGTKKNIVHIPPTRNEYSDIHNAVFPMELPAHFIENFAKESVLDLFGGTGTTLIAAEQFGRKAYLMELDPTYCDVIIARWEKFTGKQATKIN